MFGEKLLALWLGLLSSKRSLLKDQTGASAIEYALIVGLIVTALVAAFATFGEDLGGLLDNVFQQATEEASGD